MPSNIAITTYEFCDNFSSIPASYVLCCQWLQPSHSIPFCYSWTSTLQTIYSCTMMKILLDSLIYQCSQHWLVYHFCLHINCYTDEAVIF